MRARGRCGPHAAQIVPNSKAVFQAMDPTKKAASLAASIASRMKVMMPVPGACGPDMPCWWSRAAAPAHKIQYQPELKPQGAITIDEQVSCRRHRRA